MEYQSCPQPKQNFNRYFIAIYLAFAFIAGMALTTYIYKKKVMIPRGATKFEEVLSYVNAYYVDSVDLENLYGEAISAMLQTLDPHSTYADAQENKAMTEELDGAFEGVGIQFSIMNDTVMVIATISGGPSEKVGIRAGDRIVAVNDTSIAGIGIENERVIKLLRGPKNSSVKMGIMRQGFSQVYDYQVVRDVIPTYTVDVAYMIDQRTGYIKINQFGRTTGDEFAAAITKLKQRGMTKMILDLRGNPGGYLDAGIRVCDELLPNGELIVYTEGRTVPTDKIYASSYGNFESGELVVLIDDFSASASEIVAGAVQDNDRGTIIGRRSFGKGLVQRQINLADNSSIRLTVSRYHTPSGRCIQKKYDDGLNSYNEELFNRYVNGEMNSADSVKFDKSMEYKTKKGRTVYGGGGIMPDIFVPLDDENDDLDGFYQVFNSGVIYPFAFDFSTKNQTQLKRKYPTVQSFINHFEIDNSLIDSMLQEYEKKNNNALPNLSERSKQHLKVWLKAFIGRNLFQDDGFYSITNTIDKTVQKALEAN